MNKKVFNRLFKDKIKNSSYNFYPNDKLIDVCVRKFKVQQEDMMNLRKCFDDFVYEIQNFTGIIEKMYACFKTIYEPDWLGNVEFHQSCQKSMKIWRDFIDDIKTNIQMEFSKYSDKFPEIQRSIDKSNKKEIEYQRCKTAHESYRRSRKLDSSKIKKAEMEMKDAESQYHETNSILKSDLPQFFDSRIQIYIQNLSLLFNAENKLFQSLHEERQNQLQILTLLNDSCNTGKYSIMNQVMPDTNYTNNIYDKKKSSSVLTLVSPDKHSVESTLKKGSSVWNMSTPDSIYEQVAIYDRDDSSLNRARSYHVGTRPSDEDLSSKGEPDYEIYQEKRNTVKKKHSFDSSPTRHQSFTFTNNRPAPPIRSSDNSDIELQDEGYVYSEIQVNRKLKKLDNNQSMESLQSEQKKTNSKKVSISTSLDGVSKIVPEKQFYYQVVAKYNYKSQDDDELNLRKEDVIMVLPWENDDQQEIGWLYGENTITKEKGLFPENHTSPLD